MIRIAAACLLFLVAIPLRSAEPTDAATTAALHEAGDSAKVRSKEAASRAAVEFLARPESASFRPMGMVLALSRAHRQIGDIEERDLVWLVAVINRGASDLTPKPEGLFWVRLRDGSVVGL